jgi:hypothetical protein
MKGRGRHASFKGQFDIIRTATFALVGFLIAFSFLPILVVLLSMAALSLILVGFGDGLVGKRFPLLDGLPRQGFIQITVSRWRMRWRR